MKLTRKLSLTFVTLLFATIKLLAQSPVPPTPGNPDEEALIGVPTSSIDQYVVILAIASIFAIGYWYYRKRQLELN